MSRSRADTAHKGAEWPTLYGSGGKGEIVAPAPAVKAWEIDFEPLPEIDFEPAPLPDLDFLAL